ncbi:MAG TPA: NAD(P)-dependent oxidoreductase [Verrucomicrobiae bacterium]|nr:NAD(P)-dependent oxidoreductase [Verrucomicrobiae bacterium]
MRIFVTGGTGFIGSHFLRVALEAGHDVVALRRPGSHPRVQIAEEPRWVDGELESFDASALQGSDALIVLSAVGVSPQEVTWADAIRTNSTACLNLLERARLHGVARIVVAGSCQEYGAAGETMCQIPSSGRCEPRGPYAISKHLFTSGALGFARTFSMELVCLRIFHAFGEGQHPSNFWPSLRAAAHADKNFPMTEGGQVRDFVPVESVARTFLDACSWRDIKPGQPLVENVGTGRAATLRDFAESWWRHWGAKGRLLIGALPYRPGEVMRYVPEVSARIRAICEAGEPPFRSPSIDAGIGTQP